MKQQRIQISRRKGWRLPPNTVVVGWPSKWGNPFRAVDFASDPALGRKLAAEAFARWLHDDRGAGPAKAYAACRELSGQNLACWCPLPKDGEPDHCHAAVLLEVANG